MTDRTDAAPRLSADEQQIIALLALASEDFQSLITAHLGRGKSPELWAILLHPHLVKRTHAELSARYRDVEDQLAQRRAGMDSFRLECFDRGPEGKSAWFAAEREHQEWRHRCLGFRRAVGMRMREAKNALDKAQPFKVKGAIPNPPDPPRKVRHLETIFRLAWAIYDHRERCIAEDVSPEPHDFELWDGLNSIEVETSDGYITLAIFLAEITSKPGFVPPPLREGGEPA